MRLVENWRAVLARAWSVRLLLLAGLLSGFEAAMPFVGDFLPIPSGALAALTTLVVAGAFVARIVAQKDIR
ncbi:hypothetical protein [Ancylobacter pratisalsi]|uniref:Uncharacterized protein n=1 Tax=Ancylobacter pratisalsi TaxID=1745854 RepID=A0A6P1YHR5_9HYPH|nr:hypothetical protein [Ancylobacter pratisalsi]QIB32625.1 hypothetical protein G3A50_02085 [Ancylobacter pratisalsi]